MILRSTTRSPASRLQLSYLVTLCLSTLIAISPAYSCDPCALYSHSRLQGHSAGAITVGAYEQFTDFKNSKNSRKNPLRDGEKVESFSTTQLLAAYDLTQNVGVQLNLPLIYRRHQEIKRFRSSSESEFGLGDSSLLLSYTPLVKRDPDWSLILGLTGGLKLPTGDTGSIKRSTETEQSTKLLKHHPAASSSGGSLLTLGTGSYDYILGASSFARYKRAILTSYSQYSIRTEGDYNYEFADDFVWSLGTGYYLHLTHESSLAAKIALTGEHKSRDSLNNDKVRGSQFSNLYLGPQLIFTLGDNLSGEVALDFRVTSEDSEATVVPEHKVRAGLSYRFS